MRVVPWSDGVDHWQQNTLHPLWLCSFVTRWDLCVTQPGCSNVTDTRPRQQRLVLRPGAAHGSLSRQVGAGEHGVFAGDTIPKILVLLLQQSA